MLHGTVKLDGHTTIGLGMGDRFQAVIDPKHSLKCMQLIMWFYILIKLKWKLTFTKPSTTQNLIKVNLMFTNR